MTVNAADIFIRHALATSWNGLSAETQCAARVFLCDTVAVGIAGARARYSDTVLGVAETWGHRDEICMVLGRPGCSLPAAAAAFVNAFQIHVQEYDCVHEAAVVHPMTAVTAALLAQAQRGPPVSGSTFLAAVVAGVDVAINLGLAATTPIRFFRPATAGIFGAVAALARLRGLSQQTTRDAFGYALAFVSGTMQAHTEGMPALAIQFANAAASALRAVDLAAAGLPGPQASLDGPYGYLPMMETGHDLAAILPSIGICRRIDEVSHKPFPSGRATHGAIFATQTLMRAHGITADTLRSLIYRAPPLIRHLCGRPMTPGIQVAQARLCIPFVTALMLRHGTVALSDYTEQRFADPALLELASRITVEVDDNPDPAAFTPARAMACTHDGRVVELSVEALPGSPCMKLTAAQCAEKHRACLEFAGFPAMHAALGAVIDDLASHPDAGAALASIHGTAA